MGYFVGGLPSDASRCQPSRESLVRRDRSTSRAALVLLRRGSGALRSLTLALFGDVAVTAGERSPRAAVLGDRCRIGGAREAELGATDRRYVPCGSCTETSSKLTGIGLLSSS